MTRRNAKGFSVVEGLIVVVIVGLIGGLGWYVWQAQSKEAEQPPAQATSQQAPEPADPTPQVSKTHLVIAEWGIKVKLGSADPSVVEYRPGADDDTMLLSLKDLVTDNESCQSLGIDIVRQPASANPKTAVGKYSYKVMGSPAACGDPTIDLLRQQYTGDHPNTWKFISAN